MYLNSVQIIGFIGKDPERRQARGNGTTFTILSVAHAAVMEERGRRAGLQNRVASRRRWNNLGERVATALH